MIIEIKKTYNEFEDTYYFENLHEFEDDDDDELVYLAERHFRHFDAVLQNNFKTHKDLYNLINPDKYNTEQYNPDGAYFNHGSTGFKRFNEVITERELRTLSNVFTDIILNKIEHIQQRQRQSYKTRVKTTLNNKTEPIGLEKLDFNDDGYIITNNKTYKIEAVELENVNTLEDIEDNTYNTILNDLTQQLNTERQNNKDKIRRLKRTHERQQNNLFVETVKNIENMEKWDIIKLGGATWLKYKERINTESVFYNGIEYPYNSKKYPKMYVSGLKVKLNNIITEDDVLITRGYNLHFEGTTGCIGDLNGASLFEVLKNLPKTLTIANMDSALNPTIRAEISNGFLKDMEDENGDITGGSRIWTTELGDE